MLTTDGIGCVAHKCFFSNLNGNRGIKAALGASGKLQLQLPLHDELQHNKPVKSFEASLTLETKSP